MKFKKIISLFGVLLLTGCNNVKTITPEEAKQSANNIKAKIESEDFTYPTKFTATAEQDLVNKDGSGMDLKAKSKVKAQIDLDNEYYHLSYSYSFDNSSEAVVVNGEEFVYKTDDGYVDAIKYTQGNFTIKAVCYFATMDEAPEASDAFPTFNVSELGSGLFANELIYDALEEIISVSENSDSIEEQLSQSLKLPNDAKSNFKLSFTGNSEGDLGLDFSFSAKFKVTQETATASYNFVMKEKFSIDNYLIKSAYNESKVNAVTNVTMTDPNGSEVKVTGEYAQERVASTKFDYSSFELTYPDLTGYEVYDNSATEAE